MIFGPSLSFHRHLRDLEERGFPVLSTNLFEDHAPFFWKFVAGPNARQHRNRLASSIDDTAVGKRIKEVVSRLRIEHGCGKVVVMGFGYGGIMALKNPVDSVIAWYPHLVYPEGMEGAPDLNAVHCPSLLFYGQRDAELEPSYRVAAAVARRNSHIQVETVDAGHAFADFTVQGRFPSPKYRPRAARHTWHMALEFMNNLKR